MPAELRNHITATPSLHQHAERGAACASEPPQRLNTNTMTSTRHRLMPGTTISDGTTSTDTNSGKSIFFTLPPELREMIYEYALGWEFITSWSSLHHYMEPPLLQVSRELRCEVTPIYYGLTGFSGWFKDVLCRLQCLDETRIKMIRSIQVFPDDTSKLQAYADQLVHAAGGRGVLAEDVLKFPVQNKWRGEWTGDPIYYVPVSVIATMMRTRSKVPGEVRHIYFEREVKGDPSYQRGKAALS